MGGMYRVLFGVQRTSGFEDRHLADPTQRPMFSLYSKLSMYPLEERLAREKGD